MDNRKKKRAGKSTRDVLSEIEAAEGVIVCDRSKLLRMLQELGLYRREI